MSGSTASKLTLCLINKERSDRGLKPLRFDKDQQQAASKHNRVMLQKNCFSHLCPGEKDLVGRMTLRIPRAGVIADFTTLASRTPTPARAYQFELAL